MTQPIRVVVANRPRLMRELVLETIINQPDIDPPLCDTLLRLYPEMKILALAPERNSSIFYWASFDIHSIQVEASQAGLLGALRRKIQYVGG